MQNSDKETEMSECIYSTPSGDIHYWKNRIRKDRQTLVLLPGLTADRHLFDQQVKALKNEYNLLTWDAPGHAASRPFKLDFSLADKAKWLHGILEREGIQKPILIGQSMGGYVSQYFMELYPGETGGFISIDSAPLKRRYLTAVELWLLERIEPVYRIYPRKALLRDGSKGCSETAYGRKLMMHFINTYTHEEYCHLAGHGFRILAKAIEADLPYEIDCPAILICGEKDKAGSARHYNRKWAEQEGLTIYWISNAGHNANTDKPEEINGIIRSFAESLRQK